MRRALCIPWSTEANTCPGQSCHGVFHISHRASLQPCVVHGLSKPVPLTAPASASGMSETESSASDMSDTESVEALPARAESPVMNVVRPTASYRVFSWTAFTHANVTCVCHMLTTILVFLKVRQGLCARRRPGLTPTCLLRPRPRSHGSTGSKPAHNSDYETRCPMLPLGAAVQHHPPTRIMGCHLRARVDVPPRRPHVLPICLVQGHGEMQKGRITGCMRACANSPLWLPHLPRRAPGWTRSWGRRPRTQPAHTCTCVMRTSAHSA